MPLVDKAVGLSYCQCVRNQSQKPFGVVAEHGAPSPESSYRPAHCLRPVGAEVPGDCAGKLGVPDRGQWKLWLIVLIMKLNCCILVCFN